MKLGADMVPIPRCLMHAFQAVLAAKTQHWLNIISFLFGVRVVTVFYT